MTTISCTINSCKFMKSFLDQIVEKLKVEPALGLSTTDSDSEENREHIWVVETEERNVDGDVKRKVVAAFRNREEAVRNAKVEFINLDNFYDLIFAQKNESSQSSEVEKILPMKQFDTNGNMFIEKCGEDGSLMKVTVSPVPVDVTTQVKTARKCFLENWTE